MAEEDEKPAPPNGQVEPKTETKPAKDKAPAQAQAPPAAPEGEKKLSGAELKKKQKEEKAARREKAKQEKALGPGGTPSSAGAGAQAGPSQTTPSRGAQGQEPKAKLPHRGKPDAGHAQLAKAQPVRAAVAAKAAPAKPPFPECFSHLSMARRIPFTQADRDVHPAVLMLGQQMGCFKLASSIARLEGTLAAFKLVVKSYKTPATQTFSRHFTSHVLNRQIDYLTACRPMCFSMGNAIRWLKLQVSKVDIDLSDDDVKKLLCENISYFMRERITLADMMIAKNTCSMIETGSTIVTYGHHHLVERTLLEMLARGKKFRLVVVDDAYDRVGLDFARRMGAKESIQVSYGSDLSALSWAFDSKPTKRWNGPTVVLIGAEAVFSNGAMYARTGTCDVAMAARDARVKVIGVCETINCTERSAVDSLTYNEIDPDRCTDGNFRLLFDTTPQGYVSDLMTELGQFELKTIPVVLGKLEGL